MITSQKLTPTILNETPLVDKKVNEVSNSSKPMAKESFSVFNTSTSEASHSNLETGSDLSSKFLLKSENVENNKRPNMLEFMNATGLSFFDASDVLSLASTRNDVRDWSKIMNSPDPLEATRTANREMFEVQGSDIANETPKEKSTKHIIGSTEHLDIVRAADRNLFYLKDADGDHVRHLGDTSEQIEKYAYLYGLDRSEIVIAKQFT